MDSRPVVLPVPLHLADILEAQASYDSTMQPEPVQPVGCALDGTFLFRIPDPQACHNNPDGHHEQKGNSDKSQNHAYSFDLLN